MVGVAGDALPRSAGGGANGGSRANGVAGSAVSVHGVLLDGGDNLLLSGVCVPPIPRCHIFKRDATLEAERITM